MSDEDSFTAVFEAGRKEARKREATRQELRAPVNAALGAVRDAETKALELGVKYKYQQRLTEARLQLVSLMADLESESSSPNERLLLGSE